MSCNVGEATEGLANELWRRWSDGRVGEWAVTYVKWREGWRMSRASVASPTSQLILQPFRRFTYITAHSPTLPLLHIRHSSFSNPSFASPTSQALHLIHLASHPWIQVEFSLRNITAYGSHWRTLDGTEHRLEQGVSTYVTIRHWYKQVCYKNT